jgi:hypothetical protein
LINGLADELAENVSALSPEARAELLRALRAGPA